MSLSDERNENDESSEIPNEDAAAEQPDASDPESEQFGGASDTGDGDAAGEETAPTADGFDAPADESFDEPDAAAEFEGDFAAADTDAFPGTMPLFDSNGNLPADVDSIWQAVSQWEAAAAAAPDDPRFVKLPTAKPRNDLTMIDRGPSQPVVWIDRATMTPVLYAGEPEEPQTADDLPASAFGSTRSVGSQRHDDSGAQDLNVGMSRPVLLVTVDRAGQHFQKAFEARGERWLDMMQKIAQERIDYEKWWQAGEDRANGGDY